MNITEIILLIGFIVSSIYSYYQVNQTIKYKSLYLSCLDNNQKYYLLFQQNHSTAIRMVDLIEHYKNENVLLNERIYKLTIENLELKNTKLSEG